MYATASHCQACGCELPPDYDKSLCAQCSTRELSDPQATAPTEPAAQLPSRSAFTAPAEVGPVRILQLIGRGASGAVYCGYDQVLGRTVAVKFLTGLVDLGQASQDLFLQEARAAAAVRHPNLVQIHQAALSGAIPYLVLEYVSGASLSAVLDHCGPLPPPLVFAVLMEVADAVAALHQANIIHRDLKPANMMLDTEGHVRVTDLGLAQRQNSSDSKLRSMAGTPSYMAPEMFEGLASVRSDVYAVGITAFHLLAGQLPFRGTIDEIRRQHESQPLPLDLLRMRDCPAAVDDLIERATHKQRVFRYKTMSEFSRALRTALASVNLPRARRELSLLVAHCGGPKPQQQPESTPSPTAVPADYAQALQTLVRSKRQRQATPPASARVSPATSRIARQGTAGVVCPQVGHRSAAIKSRNMDLESFCAICRCEVPLGEGYVVRIDVFADPQMPQMAGVEINAADFNAALAELMEQMKDMSAEQLQDGVHRRFEYRLCPSCQRRFLANPLGQPRRIPVGKN